MIETNEIVRDDGKVIANPLPPVEGGPCPLLQFLEWYNAEMAEASFGICTNFADFVEAVEVAMTITSLLAQEIHDLHRLMADFLEEFETIYVGANPDNISRCRLCLFQLIHVPQHIFWNGSVRVGSQDTVERAIGEAGHKICSKKAPFAHLANIVHEREMMKLLSLQIPSLDILKPLPRTTTRPFSQAKIRKKDWKWGTPFKDRLELIEAFLAVDIDTTSIDMQRWGKVSLQGKTNIYSELSELRGESPTRSTRYLEVSSLNLWLIVDIFALILLEANIDTSPVFGEALAFYTVQAGSDAAENGELLVVYHPVVELHQVL